MMEKPLSPQSCSYGREALWVVDGCYYGRTAMVSLLLATGLPVMGTPTLHFDATQRSPFVERCLVLRLPPDPIAALLLTLQLPEVPWHWAECRRLIVLSPFRAGFLLRMIACLRLPCSLQVLDARLPVERLCDAVLSDRARRGIGIGSGAIGLPSLSAYERRALCESFLAMTAHTQAKRREVSVKTVYTHRTRALAKLGVKSVSGLVGRFGGMNKPCIRILGQRYKPVGEGGE